MSRFLDVFLYSHKVGTLEQDNHGQLFFTYSTEWLEKDGSQILSQSLPLQKERFKRHQCRPFFAGILPDETKREVIAQRLGISAKNDFSLLEKIGGECGGAISFLPQGTPYPLIEHKYHPLSENELVSILQQLPDRPLLAGEKGVRLSLAGAQDKIPLYYDGETFSLPLESSPSTHIIKPAITRYEGQVYNEALCLSLARHVGLPVVHADWRKTEGVEYLLVQRYDRKKDAAGNLWRIHQEDFCQALGIVPENKYQVEGGPTLKQCFDLVRRVSTHPLKDLEVLLDAVIFNLFIGNNDAHGKNFSLLYEDQSVRLAPLYDLISTAFYKDIDPHMAMKLGGEANSLKVAEKHFELFCQEVALSYTLVRERMHKLAFELTHQLENISFIHPVENEIAHLIKERTFKLCLQRSQQ
jgi:serine/threonine-protein kinase HipA